MWRGNMACFCEDQSVSEKMGEEKESKGKVRGEIISLGVRADGECQAKNVSKQR